MSSDNERKRPPKKRSGSWLDSAGVRLGALAALLAALVAVAGRGFDLWDIVTNRLFPSVSVVDHSVDCYRSDHTCAFDIWLAHEVKTRDVVVSTLIFDLVEMKDVATAGEPLPAKVYGCDLAPLRSGIAKLACPISHLIPRSEAGKPDYLRVVLSDSSLPPSVFRRLRLDATLRTNLGDTAVGPLSLTLPWDRSVSPQDPAAR